MEHAGKKATVRTLGNRRDPATVPTTEGMPCRNRGGTSVCKSREPALARSNHGIGAPITAEMPLQKGHQKPTSDGQKPYGNQQQQGCHKKQGDQPATVRTSGTEGTLDLATSRNVSNSRVTSDSSDASNSTSDSKYSR